MCFFAFLYHIISSCQSAATSKIVKCFWSWVWLICAVLYQISDLWLYLCYLQ